MTDIQAALTGMFLALTAVAIRGFWRERMVFKRTQDRAAVIVALRGGEWIYGLDIARTAQLPPGRFIRAVDTLEAEGIVEARWDLGLTSDPRRRLYRTKGRSHA